MTQADLQRDVEGLTRLHFRQRGYLAALGGGAFAAEAAEDLAALDRAIETARILASLTNAERSRICDVVEGYITADAHRKVALLMGGT